MTTPDTAAHPTPDRRFLATLWHALGGDPAALDRVTFIGAGSLPAVYPVTDLAVASVAAAGLALAGLTGAGLTGAGLTGADAVVADRRLASAWFGYALRPLGWELPPVWDAVAGDYRAADGSIRLHTNAPHHRAAALSVLSVPAERAAVARAVAAWPATELETAVVAAGGCAAAMRDAAAWAAHPQGRAVAAAPLLSLDEAGQGTGQGGGAWRPNPARPLAGIRVLDLTRVLAGPTATRFLAGCGAQVLRIDPPDWEEPALAPDMTLGKRCARLNLRAADDLATLRRLLAGADVLVHGYRPDALARLGLDADSRRALNPGLVDICLDAYGWTGPWAGRRGFDSLVQMSCGIAEAGMRLLDRDRPRDRPTPLPVQALDHATGYILAAMALRGLARRRETGRGMVGRTSLAATARLLMEGGAGRLDAPPLAPETDADFNPVVEQTTWGPARRLRPPVAVAGAPLAWDRPASPLGSASAAWE
ncbi:CoA transferase [Nitrospirillum sp. BR 11752]|uniref:CoA transferase n=1 Tax=Nitrospirillum sp. BR 11752 TaxID=3104293 RepID=UPI002E9F9BC3|nr:CoA transferase [Nitrospirillum sp. BR 11752]